MNNLLSLIDKYIAYGNLTFLWWDDFEDLQLKSDEELIKIALDLNPLVLGFASNKVRNNRKIIRAIFAKWHAYLENKSRDFVNVSPDCSFFAWLCEHLILVVGEKLRQDDEFFQSLGFPAFDRKSALREIMECDWTKYERLPRILSPKCWFDRETILQAMHRDVAFLAFAPQVLREDMDVCLAAVRLARCDALDFVGDSMFSNKDFMSEAIRIDVDCYEFISPDIEDDPDVIRAILANYPNDYWEGHFNALDIVSAMELLESIALKNPMCIEDWLERNHESISFYGKDADFQKIWEEDLVHYEQAEIDGIKRLLNLNGSFIKQLKGRTLTLLPEIILAAIPTFPDALYYAAPSLMDDPKFIRAATKVYEDCL